MSPYKLFIQQLVKDGAPAGIIDRAIVALEDKHVFPHYMASDFRQFLRQCEAEERSKSGEHNQALSEPEEVTQDDLPNPSSIPPGEKT